MPTVHVDVIVPLPEGWGICLTCEALIAQANMVKVPSERGLEEYPPEWQADFQRFSDAMLDLSTHFGGSVRFQIWDPRSLQGLLKAIRYGAHCYPTFVVNKQTKIVGLDIAHLEQALLIAGAIVSPDPQPDQWINPPV